jgi:quercetin dioxygenase-like cupin family protein
MRVLTLSVFVIVGAASMALVPVAQAQQPPQVTRYLYSPLEGDSQVGLLTVVVPPGGATAFHTHAGDQWEMIQEGELTHAIKSLAQRLASRR